MLVPLSAVLPLMPRVSICYLRIIFDYQFYAGWHNKAVCRLYRAFQSKQISAGYLLYFIKTFLHRYSAGFYNLSQEKKYFKYIKISFFLRKLSKDMRILPQQSGFL